MQARTCSCSRTAVIAVCNRRVLLDADLRLHLRWNAHIRYSVVPFFAHLDLQRLLESSSEESPGCRSPAFRRHPD